MNTSSPFSSEDTTAPTRTPFTETEILLALLDGDEATADRLLLGMYPNELDTLWKAADELRSRSLGALRIRARELQADQSGDALNAAQASTQEV